MSVDRADGKIACWLAKRQAGRIGISDTPKALAKDGAVVVDKAVRSNEEVRRQSWSLKEDTGELSLQVKGIGGILSAISDFTDQADLPAVNMALERSVRVMSATGSRTSPTRCAARWI
jgi:hypothetical protein